MRRLSLSIGKTGSRSGGSGTKKSARMRPGQPRRRAVPLWRSRGLWGGLLAVMLIGASAATWWVWRAGWVYQVTETVRWELIARSADFGFRVNDIQVTGRGRADAEAVLDAVRITKGAPILAFDADAARQRIEGLSWVRSAVVERRLPDTIFLHLVERQPAALWQNEGRFRLIDGDGTVILENGEGKIGSYGRLPIVVGPDAADELAGLFVLLETDPALGGRLASAARVGGRRWNVWLKVEGAEGNGEGKNRLIEVWLPEVGAVEAWQKLGQYQKESGLLDRDLRLIDLRLPDRVTIRPASQPDVQSGAQKKPKREI